MKTLIINLKFGLANRLRALASGYIASQASGRKLIVIWETDEHCQATLDELFILDELDVYADTVASKIDISQCDTINCMSIDGNDSRPLIDFETESDLYIITYCELNSKYENAQKEHEFLRDLSPSRSVQQIIDKYDVWDCTGVHIRMMHAANSTYNFEKPDGNWSEQDQETLSFFRGISDYRYFIGEMKRMIEKNPQLNFFLCCDNEEIAQKMITLFGDKIIYVQKPTIDRSKEAIKYALADFILLSQTQLIMGSYGSSFSKVAQAIGGQEIKYTGRNFGSIDDPALIKDKKEMESFFAQNTQLLNFLRARLDFVWKEKSKSDYHLQQAKQEIHRLKSPKD